VIALVDGPFAGERVVADPAELAQHRGLSFAVRGDQRELLRSLEQVVADAEDPRARAARIGREWRAVHYRTIGVMKLEYEGTFRIVARPERGRVGVRRAERLRDKPSVWRLWLASLDEPAQRFAEVVRLFPPGPLSEYVTDLSGDVTQRLLEAERLANVGEAAYPRWLPGDIDPRAEAILARIDDLHADLGRALDALVDLHLAVGRQAEPEIPRLEALVDAWRDLLDS